MVGVSFYIAYSMLNLNFVNVRFKTVTHTLIESCCVEEFLPSAGTEDIWGFNRAIEMLGVSLVIFFSLCNAFGSKMIIIWNSKRKMNNIISNYVRLKL